MFSREGLALVTGIALFSVTDVILRAEAHPGCKGDVGIADNLEATFCPTDLDVIYEHGFCCDEDQEMEITRQLGASNATERCAEMQQEVLCTACNPFSLHLYERLVNGLTMTAEFCAEFYEECSGPDQLDLGEDYCDRHVSLNEDGEDAYWSYPLEIPDWDPELVEFHPELEIYNTVAQPIDMRMTPDGTKWWIVDMEGRIVEIDVSDPESPPSSMEVVLDISSDILHTYEEGLFGVAFSPGFHTTGVFFISYTPTKRVGSQYGFNRLSRFQYDASSAVNTRNSEEILLESSDKFYAYHSGGWLGFKPSAYESASAGTFHDLYWSMGDSGNQFDKSKKAQDPDELHGSIMRISVNSNMGTDHEIPDGNPFQAGGGLPEICAMGFRNPFKCSFDRANDELWCGDVGQDQVESVKKIECGNNYGWRQFEGHRCVYEIQDGEIQSFEDGSDIPIPFEFPLTCAEDGVRDGYTFPEFSFCHEGFNSDEDYLFPEMANGEDFCGNGDIDGSAIIGGFVYRGEKYKDLFNGNYIWGDHTTGDVYHLITKDDGWGPADGNKYLYGVVQEQAVKPSGFAEDNSGELYILEHSRDGHTGRIWHLSCGEKCGGDGVFIETDPPTPVTPVPTPAPVDLPPIPENPDYDSVGCYRDGLPRIMGSRVAYSDAGMSTETCGILCTGSVYFGTQNGNECFCGDASAELDIYCSDASCSNASCSTPCTGDSSEDCGGPWAMSVYQYGDITPPTPAPDTPPTPTPTTIAPSTDPVPEDYVELGCAVDAPDPNRVMPVGPIEDAGGDMSADICYGLCAEELPDFLYFGTQYGYQCFCATAIPSGLFNPEHSGCTSTCSGFPGQTCGGSWSLTVYQVGDEIVPTPAPTSEFTPAPTNGDNEFVELGCSADSQDDRLMSVGPLGSKGDAMSAEICYVSCQSTLPGFVYFGTQYSYECFCATTLSDETYGYDGCTFDCTGNPGETCGGQDAITVYQVGDPNPAYEELGCAADDKNNRVMTTGPIGTKGSDMSAEICLGICQDELPGFAYFGTQYNYQCWCSMALPDDLSFNPEHDGCTYACTGNPGETCGGFDAITVYSV